MALFEPLEVRALSDDQSEYDKPQVSELQVHEPEDNRPFWQTSLASYAKHGVATGRQIVDIFTVTIVMTFIRKAN
jgi:hypothetical protein